MTSKWLFYSQIRSIGIWCHAHFIWMEIAASSWISVGEQWIWHFELIREQPTSKTVSIIWFHFFFHRFSHGETVLYTDLKDYNKPNFSLINQVKHPVLAKQADNIWYKGRVVTSDFNDKTCLIKFEHTKKEVKCDFHDVLPIEEGKSRKKKQAKRPAMRWNMEDLYEIYHL